MKIGNNVYIGPHSVIARGVTIGDRVVVGANGLVREDVPSGKKVAGNPARSWVTSTRETPGKTRRTARAADMKIKAALRRHRRSGFIGSHLVDALLARGAARVAVVDVFFLGKDENLAPARGLHGKRLHVYRDDASDMHAMSAVLDIEKPDVVFNLATKALIYSFFNPAGALEVNVNLALTCLELLRKGAYGRLIHVSTSEVYGTAQTVSMDESHPLLAETTYAAGKAAADLAVNSYVKMFGVDATIVRPFNDYGLRQNDETYGAVIPLTVRRILTGEMPIIEGTGDQTRDFIYVLDTVDAMLQITRERRAQG